MKTIEEICEHATKVSDVKTTYECVSKKFCKLIFKMLGVNYCKYPLDPKKHKGDLPNQLHNDHYLKYFSYGGEK